MRTPAPLGKCTLIALALVLSSTAAGGCARPALPTLSLHAALVLHDAANGERIERGRDLALQARLLFRQRGAPSERPASELLPAYLPQLPMLHNCSHTLLCEWAQLSEESALLALGVAP